VGKKGSMEFSRTFLQFLVVSITKVIFAKSLIIFPSSEFIVKDVGGRERNRNTLVWYIILQYSYDGILVCG
jgi:hypothetical protein